jgi:hypothetical protein
MSVVVVVVVGCELPVGLIGCYVKADTAGVHVM